MGPYNPYQLKNVRIRRLIYKCYPSIAQFALALDTYADKISKPLNGYRLIPLEEAQAWARHLDCSVEALAAITRDGKGAVNAS